MVYMDLGHASFIKSPDDGQYYIIYHGNTNKDIPKGIEWWEDRIIFIQPFSWNSDGTPNFGEPINPKTKNKK